MPSLLGPKQLSGNRVYASTRGSIDNLPCAGLEKEIHIAGDYDSEKKYQTGKFFPYFDTSKLNAEAIQNIKDRAMSTSVKFFLSIGGRDSKFPFAVTSAQQSAWIQNATESLKEIFADSIQKVIWRLKNDKTISSASVTVSAPLSKNYHDLYKKNDKNFDYVVYQSHTELSPISTFQEVGAVFDKLPYPKEKILAGHSDVRPGDWTTVPPPIFLGAVPQLLNKGLFGISKWIVTPEDYNPEP
ncbi:ruBisCO-associated protein-like [Neltuma alba]|uniref:ruBisCO-associated protein-like n=1 Tax=Neltuma alba TaxID=207710 RepID=UPI0010A59BCA|nr:ruBisCO-associated protein-like [Prosopis alba]